MTAMMLVHILFGGISIVAGFLSLFSRKGRKIHRTAGIVFVVSMSIMALVGTYIAFKKPEMITALAGLFTTYLVISSVVTVRYTWMLGSWQGIILAGFSLCVGAAFVYFGIKALQSVDGSYHGFPAGPYLFFGVMAIMSAVFDLRAFRINSIDGWKKIGRHAWRMSFALLIATSSLFDGPGVKIFPELFQGSVILLVPQIIVFVLMIYWIVRIYKFKKLA